MTASGTPLSRLRLILSERHHHRQGRLKLGIGLVNGWNRAKVMLKTALPRNPEILG
jgi:hypothetical protein